MEKNILILSTNKFPNGDAGSVRQYTFSKLFKRIGWEPFIIGMGDSTNFIKKEYNSINYISFRSEHNHIFSRLMALITYKKRLKLFLNENKDVFSRILVIDIPFSSLFFIKRFAKKNKIPIYHDSVEWYSPEQFKLSKLSINYLLKELYNTYWIDNSFNIIAISKYLEDHFNNKGCKSVRIPAILDVKNMSFNKHTNSEKLTMVYAGSPGKKDYLKDVIEGIYKIDEVLRGKLEFRIIGITRDQVKNLCGVDEEILQSLNNIIVYKDRVKREEVLKNLEEADFTVLIRSPYQRYAKAGFPTKVVESLASGTPVICNLTSDLVDYIKDGENGIIVEECSAEAISISIKRALTITFEHRKMMYKNARKCAEESFDYTLYTEIIRGIL